MSDLMCKKLSELIELKSELEKRGLDKDSVKQKLMERLKAITEEGEDPNTYLSKLTEEKAPKKSLSGKNGSDRGESEDSTAVKKEDSKMDTKTDGNPSGKGEKRGSKSPKDENHESPINLTLDEEEKIQDMEAMSEMSSKDKADQDVKKTANEEETKDVKTGKSDAAASANKKDGPEQTTSVQDGKKVPSNANPRAIWISNVAMNTRACDIKQALSQYGKVVGAKVVVNAKYPGTCCFGYVTMGSVEDANKVIENLNNTELNGQIIKIEKFDVVRSEQLKQIKNGRKTPEHLKPTSSSSSTSKKESDKSPSISSKDDDGKPSKSASEDKDKSKPADAKSDKEVSDKSDDKKEFDKDKNEKNDKKETKDRNREDERKRHSSSSRRSRERKRTSSSREPAGKRSRSRERKQREILTFDKIREARERQRIREKERLLREEARRRHEETIRQREIERRQRSEAQRLEREREKLRLEREKIEREKNELIRLERERQKLERERIELEKMELQRTRIRLEEDRRAVKRPAPFRRESSFDDRKRSSDGRHYGDVAPPPPHYEGSSKLRESPPTKKFSSKDYKASYDKRDIPEKRSRDYEERNRTSSSSLSRPSSSSKFESRSYEGIRERDTHSSREAPPSVSSRVTKEHTHRFERERDRSPHYRSGERRVTDDIPRFGNSSSSWNSSSNIPAKPFNNSSSSSKWPSKEDSWRSNQSERWNSSSRSQTFTGNSSMNITPACPPPPGINSYPDRFDYNKIPSSVRKY